ncbi:MAG: hypothetical protein G01um10143_56 [Parcubacteria group bacterium Gr01-1014_3]|nr:MAG: hypothetical protein G01um10143_56 [Parcubacteria group bacterium Gr01-1014_3]
MDKFKNSVESLFDKIEFFIYSILVTLTTFFGGI